MRRKKVSREDVLEVHPSAPENFCPDYLISLDEEPSYIKVHEGNPCSWGYRPGDEEPSFAILPTGLWQSLERHGRVKVLPLAYQEDYVPLGQRDGRVYFVRAESGSIKIGWSQNVERRLSQLQVGSSEPLNVVTTMPGTMNTEKSLHQRFAKHQIEGAGGEWFHPGEDLLRFIDSLAMGET